MEEKSNTKKKESVFEKRQRNEYSETIHNFHQTPTIFFSTFLLKYVAQYFLKIVAGDYESTKENT